MCHLASKILILLASASFVLLSLLPGRVALCIGGGHDWSEIIASPCGHGGHHHGADRTHVHLDQRPNHDQPETEICQGCAHHASEHERPCTDIESPDFDVRMQQQSGWHIPSTDDIATPMPVWIAWALGAAPALQFSIAAHESLSGPTTGPPRAVAESLRAVILLI